MNVVKRDGRKEPVAFDKITQRIGKLCYGLSPDHVSPTQIAQKVIQGVYDGVTTVALDDLAAETAAYLTTQHPDYSRLAARIAVSNLHKMTSDSFSKVMTALYGYINPKNGQNAPLVSDEVLEIATLNKERLDAAIVYQRDYEYDFFGYKTLEKSYLLRIDGVPAERPQQMLMRVSLGIHKADIDAAIETYHLMSEKWFTHATPTMFNAGTPAPQMSSCFLLAMKEDSIDGIFETLSLCAQISKSAGGIGLSVSNIRASGSYIKGSGGTSNGLVPMLRVYDNTARYVDQGGGKRKGAFAVYLEPWHADVMAFLDLKKNHGKEEARARDLFYAMWVPDLFMKRIQVRPPARSPARPPPPHAARRPALPPLPSSLLRLLPRRDVAPPAPSPSSDRAAPTSAQTNGDWSFFCPSECPGLVDSWGADFERLYEKYESEGRARTSVKAQQLWFAILDSQMETGTPYMLYKDSANRKSNQQNLGTIRCSNLCTEIIEYTSPEEVAVCNLASVALPRFVTGTTFDHQKLYDVTYTVTRNLNRVIDNNFYPVEEARFSNMKHRPIGLGVQGLADVFIHMRLPFDSEGAREVNKEIFETMYFAALSCSADLAATEGHYESYPGSPVSKGVLQFDMWGVTPSKRWDWAEVKSRIAKHGVRNSLLLAPMPTASTAQILGNNECFEPYTSNLYARRTLAGEFFVPIRSHTHGAQLPVHSVLRALLKPLHGARVPHQVLNPHLQRELQARGLWSRETRDAIIAAGGSVQELAELPEKLRAVFKTAWEMKQRHLIDMAADRGAYIDQSQSLNLFLKAPTFSQLSSMHFYGWKKGLKTGMYYLRSQPATEAIKFTIASSQAARPTSDEPQTDAERAASCALNSAPGECEMCSG